MISAFLDANVYFAGIYSPNGASAVILGLASQERFAVLETRLVLLEAERNLSAKAGPKTVERFHHFLKKTAIKIVPDPDDKHLSVYEELIHPKDVPVLAAAVKHRSDYLVTLDRRHFLKPELQRRFKRPLILTPGDFLNRLR